MIGAVAMILCSIAAFLMLLDFLVKRFTTYNIAKSTQCIPMYPIIGATKLLFISQRKFLMPFAIDNL